MLLTVGVVVVPDFHELIGGQLLQLLTLSIAELPQEILTLAHVGVFLVRLTRRTRRAPKGLKLHRSKHQIRKKRREREREERGVKVLKPSAKKKRTGKEDLQLDLFCSRA